MLAVSAFTLNFASDQDYIRCDGSTLILSTRTDFD
jgi:hypothetical protein